MLSREEDHLSGAGSHMKCPLNRGIQDQKSIKNEMETDRIEK